MSKKDKNVVVWECSTDQPSSANMVAFRRMIETRTGQSFDSYYSLHNWSIENLGEFWSNIWDFCAVQGDKGKVSYQDNGSMLSSEFFPQARLNFAENLLSNPEVSSSDDALVFWGEKGIKYNLTWQELRDSVSRMRQSLEAFGVTKGDRVVGFLPNIPETIIAMLAVSSVGAIWSSCSPDFGVQGVVDRFGQIAPKLLIAADGYFYKGNEIDNLAKIAEIAQQLPTVEKTIIVSFMRKYSCKPTSLGNVRNALSYEDCLNRYEFQNCDFERFSFNLPLYILYSSGTTGAPKCIVHGAGGTLLQHLKEHQLHNDLKPRDRIFYFTTCTWMMWNWLVSGLASGATLLLYDGSPFYSTPAILFDLAEQEAATHFSTSAKYIDALKKEKLDIINSHDLSSLRVVNSTGSPLVSESFDYVYENVKQEIYLASISGGTDILSCFVLGNPSIDLYRGEIACAGLGMAVEIWDDTGQPVEQQKGELVCIQPFPSMPLYFWNDEDNLRYKTAYFEKFANVWAQGDYAEITENGGFIIHGRSDTTLNPGGVRIGTSEIYRQVEQIDGIEEAVVIGQAWEDDVRVILFVVMLPGFILGKDLIEEIRARIRQGASPRHVPSVIRQVTDIPRTKSGKISEITVRDAIEGREIKNSTALANPEVIEHFYELRKKL